MLMRDLYSISVEIIGISSIKFINSKLETKFVATLWRITIPASSKSAFTTKLRLGAHILFVDQSLSYDPLCTGTSRLSNNTRHQSILQNFQQKFLFTTDHTTICFGTSEIIPFIEPLESLLIYIYVFNRF